MQEYWVNVYDFSAPAKLDGGPAYQLGAKHKYKEDCQREKIDWGVFYQTPLYRIHVKMKPVVEYKATVIGNCGKLHNSFEEWQACKACDRPAYPSGREMNQRMNKGAVEFAQIFKDAKKEFEEVVRDTPKGLMDGYRSGY